MNSFFFPFFLQLSGNVTFTPSTSTYWNWVIIVQFVPKRLESTIIDNYALPFLLAIHKIWFQLLYTWTIPNTKSLLDFFPKFLYIFHVRYGWSKYGFNGVKQPWDKHWINGPPIFKFWWIVVQLFDGSIHESIYLFGLQNSMHSTRPFIIVITFQLNLGNYISWIIVGSQCIGGQHFSVRVGLSITSFLPITNHDDVCLAHKGSDTMKKL